MIYRTKPREQVRVHHAALYTPGRSLDDLLAVALRKDRNAALAEVQELGVLVVRYLDVHDYHPDGDRVKYEVVPEYHYLVYSPDDDVLYSDDARSFESEHEEVKGD